MEHSHCQMIDVISSHSTRIQVTDYNVSLFPLNHSVFIFISTKKQQQQFYKFLVVIL